MSQPILNALRALADKCDGAESEDLAGLLQARMPSYVVSRIKIDENGCWRWQGPKLPYGYGQFWLKKEDGERKKWRIHCFTYTRLIGPIPEGKEIDHLCRVRDCCNPLHLEAVTHHENMLRATNAIKTHCPQGHEYTVENARFRKRGSRDCRKCDAQKHQAIRDAKKGGEANV